MPGLLSANAGSWQESDMIAASDWAITNGANILSNSWWNETNLVMSGIDKYFDHVVFEHLKTVTVASGNNDTRTGNVYSPGLGYNVITVGGFDDKDTSTWSDDMMWAIGQSPGSSWKDPLSQHMDREKPEVSAVATHGTRTITSTQPFPPWIDKTPGAGTSYAAPAVAAEAALLMQANTILKNWPEVTKAVIMTSAVHNIEGNGKLSEYDGAGGIDILKAYETVINNRWKNDLLVASSLPKDYPFSASAGQKVRVAVVWDSHPDNNHPPNEDNLTADLDIQIYDPSGALVTSSASFDNSYEIVEFTAATAGTYKARLTAYRFDGGFEYIGFAYTYV